jgi:hypothetical protein
LKLALDPNPLGVVEGTLIDAHFGQRAVHAATIDIKAATDHEFVALKSNLA